MSLVVPLVLAGVAVLLMAVFTVIASRRQRRDKIASTPATLVGPRVLIHDINDDRCTGCDACVAVCPTNVLDLVANKSRVLRFHDCIQCEACMVACPTEALVMFPQGSQPPPLKVPELDECFQTLVPGQYLIGEVAGKPLVKNAANLGRAVVEHMLAMGLRPTPPGHTSVDVAIVGSGPGGISAALTCIQRGLSYVLLEKEQLLASTIARYPKGKLVMAEPYDTENLSLLPVFDASKEQLLPIWEELIGRTGLHVKRGESVETIGRAYDNTFEIRTTVSLYRAQRVVLSIGTRGKPRTLQVQGENLPKVHSLLDDPNDWRERWVAVVGGGDSACEAALALADAGAKVILSYRGKAFSRASPRNKASIEQYAAENRLRIALGSAIVAIEPDAIVIALGDGTQQRYRNDGVFVLIGSDPPIAWLEHLGIRFVERPHSYQLGRTDLLVRRLIAAPMPCPEVAMFAAAQVLNQPVDPAAYASPAVEPIAPPPPAASGPKKWLQSATSVFATRFSNAKKPPPLPPRKRPPASPAIPTPLPGMPTPLYGGPANVPTPAGIRVFAGAREETTATQHHGHSGDGRRDLLQPHERTRILRMLRDEGAQDEYTDQSFDLSSIPLHPSIPSIPSIPSMPDEWALPPPGPTPDRPIRVSTRMPIVADEESEQVHIGSLPPKPPPPPKPIPSLPKPVAPPEFARPASVPPASAQPTSAPPRPAFAPPAFAPPAFAPPANVPAASARPNPASSPPSRPPPNPAPSPPTPVFAQPPPASPPPKPTSKFVDAAKTEIASFEHLHGDATTPERRWPEVAPSTDPHVPDFDRSKDD